MIDIGNPDRRLEQRSGPQLDRLCAGTSGRGILLAYL